MPPAPSDSPSLALPAALLANDAVPVEERSVVAHDHHFDLYDPVAGIAVVGVTDADGRVLLRVHDDEPYAVLPHAAVEHGADWGAAARDAVVDLAGIEVELDGVVLVKHKRYTPEGDDDRVTDAYQVFVDARRATDAAVAADDAAGVAAGPEDWTVGWYDAVPVAETDDNAETLADIRLFL